MIKKIVGQLMVCLSVQIPTAIALGDSVSWGLWWLTVVAVGGFASIGHALYGGELK